MHVRNSGSRAMAQSTVYCLTVYRRQSHDEASPPWIAIFLDGCRKGMYRSGRACQVANLSVAFQPLTVSKNLKEVAVQRNDWLFTRTPVAADGHNPEAHSRTLRTREALHRSLGSEAKTAVSLGGGDAPIR